MNTIDPGRFERRPKGSPLAAQRNFGSDPSLLHHPQGAPSPRPALHPRKLQPTPQDWPAGVVPAGWKPASNGSDPTILHHPDNVARPRHVPLLLAHSHANHLYVSAVEAAAKAGLRDGAAHQAAIKAVFGDVGALAADRPATAPAPLQKRGVLVGRPRQPLMASDTPHSQRVPRYTPPVPTHVVRPSSASSYQLQRSQNRNHVAANIATAGSTPRRRASEQQQQQQQQQGRTRAAWKLGRFESVPPRVFNDQQYAAMAR